MILRGIYIYIYHYAKKCTFMICWLFYLSVQEIVINKQIHRQRYKMFIKYISEFDICTLKELYKYKPSSNHTWRFRKIIKMENENKQHTLLDLFKKNREKNSSCESSTGSEKCFTNAKYAENCFKWSWVFILKLGQWNSVG